MSTYLEIVNEVLDELNEVRLTSANFANATSIQRYVKEAVNRAYLDVHDVEYKWPWTATAAPQDDMLGNTYIETVAGQRWYLLKAASADINSDYGHVDWEHFSLTEEGVAGKTNPYEVRNLKFISTEEWRDMYALSEDAKKYDTTSYGIPARVFRSPDNRRFGISPIPDGVYRIYFTAYDQLTLLSAHDDTLAMPSQYVPVLTARVRYFAWQFKQDPNQAVIAKDDFEKGMKQMRRAVNPVDLKLSDDRVRYI